MKETGKTGAGVAASVASSKELEAPARRRLVLPPAKQTATPEQVLELRRFHYGSARDDSGVVARMGLRPAWLPEATAGAAVPEDDAGFDAVRLLVSAACRRYRQAWSRWSNEAEALVRALEGLLSREGPDRSGAERALRLAHELGDLSARFLDTTTLARSVQQRGGPTAGSTETRDPGRWMRIEQALMTLQDARDSAQRCDARLVCERQLAEAFGSALEGVLATHEGLELTVAEDPCLEAASFFDRVAERVSAVLAAQRCARLELDGLYRPEVHDAALGSFNWRAFQSLELALLPPALAVVSANRVMDAGMPALSRLLRSGRAVQVLVLVDPLSQPGAEGGGDVEGFRSEIAYLGLGHRGAFVEQGCIGAREHLELAFERALASSGAALHTLASGLDRSGEGVLAAAAVASRAHPCFLFDPQRGGDWAQRFSLEGNPEVAADWPQAEIEVTENADPSTTGGGTLRLAFTFADYVLASGRGSDDLLLIDDQLASDALVPLADWLRLKREASERTLPFLWAVDPRGFLHRLLVRRSLAFQTRDRLDFWCTLQQLGGVHDAYAEAVHAEDLALVEARLEEQREQLAAEHAAALEQQREQVARDVVRRLMQGLAAKG